MSSALQRRLPGWMAVILIFDGAPDRAAIVSYCDRARALLEGAHGGPMICDVGAVVRPDAVTIEALARLHLTALRLGSRIVLRDTSAELDDLLAFAGLGEAIPSTAGSVVEPVGHPEEREQVRGVEEEADAGDATA
jgi:hypothetical protein